MKNRFIENQKNLISAKNNVEEKYLASAKKSEASIIRRALEKQIPKEPLREKKFYGIGICPNCKAVFLDKDTSFCGNCGQALLWDLRNKN